jgi:hypothetical protein
MAAIVVIFFFVFEKKMMTMNRHLFLWFCCGEEGNDTKLPSPSSMMVL